MPRRIVRAPVIATIYAAVLGAIGFACGAAGNALLAANPGSAAPLVGYFFTGPLAAIGGLIIGIALGFTRLSNRVLGVTLAILGVVTALASLSLVIPMAMPEAEIVEGRVVTCEPAASLVAKVNEDNRGTVARMIDERPGVVLTLDGTRQRWLMTRAWRAGYTQRWLERWEPGFQQRVFVDVASGNCADVKTSPRYVLTFEHDTLPEFFGFRVARPPTTELTQEN